ncbi:hypothetical protein [Commensalibacter intestini]|uniref:hypothetical protein n=1 Tax=Commensalibacter intestini TaxID=479936 RepID=UPI00118607AD|nr:hypothetical protein [Commensalibacter intestini]
MRPVVGLNAVPPSPFGFLITSVPVVSGPLGTHSPVAGSRTEIYPELTPFLSAAPVHSVTLISG